MKTFVFKEYKIVKIEKLDLEIIGDIRFSSSAESKLDLSYEKV